MKNFLVLLGILFLTSIMEAKEWKNLKVYQKETNHLDLQPQDWLKCDRTHNTPIWMSANLYNLEHLKPEEYRTVKQRKDFFAWLLTELEKQGHEVIWPRMAYFISNKLRLLECFPYDILTTKKMKAYANAGSETVFLESFETLRALYHSDSILKGEDAKQWDERILYKEQYEWIEKVYQTMDEPSIAHIERIAKGKSFYGIFVPKAIRFEGDIAKAEDRYDYALHKLRSYCKSLNKK